MSVDVDKIKSLKEAMVTNQEVLEKSLLFLYSYQTNEEKESTSTIEDNGVGFNGFDGKSLSYMGEYLKKGRHLSGKYLEKAQRMMPKYAKQIVELREKQDDNNEEKLESNKCHKCGKTIVHPNDYGDYDDACEWSCDCSENLTRWRDNEEEEETHLSGFSENQEMRCERE